MNNPIKWIINFFKKLIRKREFNKRQDIYDDVTSRLQPLIDDKREKQQQLIDKIKDNFLKDTGVVYGSSFIPTKTKNNMHIMVIIEKKYGALMSELDVELTYDLKLKCI